MKYVKIAVLALTLIGATLPEMAQACRHHRRCCDCCCESCCNSCNSCGSNCGSGCGGGCEAAPAPAPAK